MHKYKFNVEGKLKFGIAIISCKSLITMSKFTVYIAKYLFCISEIFLKVSKIWLNMTSIPNYAKKWTNFIFEGRYLK